jgi:antitoxin component of RelBE/YafQ-DinJ toxin-antitoxin module
MNITLSVDEQVISQARQVATAMNKSLNQLVRDYLTQLAQKDNIQHELAELAELTQKGQGHSKGWRFNREEIYEERTSLS